MSALGTVAGVTGTETRDVTVFDQGTPYPMTESGNPAVTRDGVFVLPNTFSGTIGSLRVTRGSRARSWRSTTTNGSCSAATTTCSRYASAAVPPELPAAPR